jgi:hypothetical protein
MINITILELKKIFLITEFKLTEQSGTQMTNYSLILREKKLDQTAVLTKPSQFRDQ